jgi:hypothetical protein
VDYGKITQERVSEESAQHRGLVKLAQDSEKSVQDREKNPKSL